MSRPPEQSMRILICGATPATLATDAHVAKGAWARAKGLLGRRGLNSGEALIFAGCRSIHTVGMRFAIDAVFVDVNWRVVAIYPELRPWRMTRPVWEAWGVIELEPGTITRAGLRIGDRLTLAAESPDAAGRGNPARA